ncbi:hypothetical protein MMC18_005706 [Xylographa bjoerkii]|nr:hypothetical protein [Xylographa bjoerkii]
MAEIQQWRRLVQHRRSRTDLNNQAIDTDKIETASVTSTTSFQARSEAEMRPHPKSRLASYLSTHRTQALTDKLEDPAFNWAPPKDRDRVYDPDLEAMCNTLRGRVLKFPSKDLPAQYNSFVLHLVEGYQHLLVERNALQSAVDTQMAHEQDNLEKFPDTSSHWVRGRRSLEPVLSSEDPFLPKERRGSDETGTVKKLKENGSLHRAQTRNSHRTSESDHSSMIGDLLPDEQEEEASAPRKKNTQIAFHLASWLAHRTGSDLDAVYPEIAEIISAYSVPENGPLQSTCLEESTNPSSTQTETAVIEARADNVKPKARDHKSDHTVNVQEVEKKHNNQRPRFSFLPGDDIQVSRLTGSGSNSLLDISSERKSGRYNVEAQLKSKDNDRVRKVSAVDEARGISTGPTDEENSEPRRGDSNRSVLTAINNGSYSSSSGTLRVGSSNSGSAKKSDHVASTAKKDSFAAAAARIAGQNKADPK